METVVTMEPSSFLGLTNEMVYLVGIPIVFALIAIEVFVMSIKHVRYYNWDDTLGTLGMLAGNVAMGVATKSLFFGCMLWTYQYRLFDLQAALSPWLLCIVALFLIDLMFYIWHRASHRVRFLWAICCRRRQIDHTYRFRLTRSSVPKLAKRLGCSASRMVIDFRHTWSNLRRR